VIAGQENGAWLRDNATREKPVVARIVLDCEPLIYPNLHDLMDEG